MKNINQSKLSICRATVFYLRGSSYAFLVLLISAWATTTNGATYVVNTTIDTNSGSCPNVCSLRIALESANASTSDDVIEFDPTVFGTPQAISLTVPLELTVSPNGALIINGPGADLLTVAGNANRRVFRILAGASAALDGFTITGGVASFGGGGINNLGDLILTNMTVSNNTSTSSEGGGITSLIGSTLQISNSTIRGNTASTGAGIYCLGPTTITDSVISGNISGGGVVCGGNILNISNSTFTANTGSAIRTTSNSSQAVLDNLVIVNNGYGISTSGQTSINNSLVSGNSLTGLAVGGNGGTMLIEGCSVENNGESGVHVGGGSTVEMINSNVSNNNTSTSGAGVHVNGGTFNAVNTTISGNVATNSGGGINVLGTVNLSNVTITNNRAEGAIGGGGIYTNSGAINLRNTLLADNEAPQGPDVRGTLNSLGYNLIENTALTVLTGNLTGNILGKDPRLAKLRDNQGNTYTVGLRASSPAIDAGDPDSFPATDQRGIARPFDGDLNGTSLPDIGAYEREVVTFTVSKTSDSDDGVCDADCSLREAIMAMNESTAIDKEVIFESALFESPQLLELSLGELTLANGNGTLAISGRGSNVLTVDGGGLSRVFTNTSGSDTTLANLTIQGGNGAGSLNTGFGGGINNNDGSLNIVKSLVRNNSASSGGAISCLQGRLTTFDSVISGNNAVSTGGGVYVAPDATVSLTNTVVGNNVAAIGGAVGNEGYLSARESEIAENSAGSGGGGGINNFLGATADITQTTLRNNTIKSPLGDGGGLFNSGTITISQSTLNGNFAGVSGSGGAIFNSNLLTLNGSTVSGNHSANAGGIENQAGTATVTYATIAFNSATMDAGGVRNSGNGIFSPRNTLIANNNALGAGADFLGNFASRGYNLLRNSNGAVIIGDPSGNVFNVDPRLDAVLRFNGGSTKNHLPALNSPVIDQGRSTTPITRFDQRGLNRNVNFPSIPNPQSGNGSDIGAVERQFSDRAAYTNFDYDGDGKSDISVFRPSDGNWYLQQSTDGFFGVTFGIGTDKIVPADYDGDGKTDVAVYRPSTGFWYVVNSSDGTFSSYGFGIDEDLPAPADYDGDGKADVTVFRPSTGTWYRQNSSDGSFSIVQFGTDGDRPTIGDFDGDGKADIAVFRPSNGAWYQLNSSDGSFFGEQFGIATDKITPADYDGDGKTDIAIYRPSEGLWYYKNSATPGTYTPYVFGLAEDIPVPGDYDGDGKADIAVFRPSNGHWYIANSSNATFTIFPWGQNGDRPTPSAFGN